MMRTPKGKKLLTVGLISDTHCNEREDFSTSPYPANAEANPRARHAFACLEREKPAFMIHLGDMINPVPELPTYEEAANRFHDIVKDLTVPLHLTPGNHDIGDKPVSWMPAGMIDDHGISIYEKHFGKHYYAVRAQGMRFLVLNAPLINSGHPKEAEQRRFVETEFTDDPDVRTFVIIHYPLYVSDPDEPGSYDNIEEPGRSWLIGLVRRYKPEALFAAHVHNFWYDVLAETETYVLPSTCFVRHDYSEMYRVGPGDQYGRNDSAKLGYAVLDIHETGHVVYYQRSYAQTLGPDATLPDDTPTIPRVHTKTATHANLAVDMRRSWAEEFDVAPSGAVDEFRRKRARNDYPVMAIWEMGLKTLRVPIQDLEDDRVRHRMRLLADVGNTFHVYCYGCPDARQTTLLARHRDLVRTLEVVVNWETIAETSRDLINLHEAAELHVCLSRVNRKDAAKTSGGRYNHLISHGFGAGELDEVAETLGHHDPDCAIASVMVSIPRDTSPWEAARQADAWREHTGRRPVLYVKSTSASPAEAFMDDAANAQRIMHAAFAAIAWPDLDIVLDCFTDADRGYFTRTGLVDGRYNPRLAGQLLQDLMARLPGKTDWRAGSETSEPTLVSGSGETLSLTVSPGGAPSLS